MFDGVNEAWAVKFTTAPAAKPEPAMVTEVSEAPATALFGVKDEIERPPVTVEELRGLGGEIN